MASAWMCMPSVVTWFGRPQTSSNASLTRQNVRRPRETLSQRMKRVASERAMKPVSVSSSSLSPVTGTSVLSPGMDGSAMGAGGSRQRSLQTLEELCIQEVVMNPGRLFEGCMDTIPDYIRQDVFERLFKRNHLMLHGKLLRSLLVGVVLDVGNGSAHFTNLSLRHASNLRDSDLIAIAPSLVSVRKLDISHCPYVSDAGVAAVLASCHTLSSLRLERLPDLEGDLSFGSEEAPSPALSSLTVLSLGMCPKFSGAGLAHVRAGAPALKSLDLSSCKALEPDTIAQMAFADMTWLSLAGCPLHTDHAVQSVIRGCSNLERIDLSGCTQLGDAVLKVMAARLESLVELNVSFLERITDAGVAMLAMGCPQLAVLQMEQTEITDESLRALAENGRSLRELNVAFCHFLSERALLECRQPYPTSLPLTLHAVGSRLRSLNVNHCRSVSMQTRFWLMAKAGNHRDGEAGGGGSGGGGDAMASSPIGAQHASVDAVLSSGGCDVDSRAVARTGSS